MKNKESVESMVIANKQEDLKKTLNMAWPAVLESFFVAFAGLVDSLMVSTIGPSAVAAVGLTTQPKFLGLALFIAINVSVSALVARRKGENNRRGANQVFLMALIFTVTAGAAVSLLCVFFADPIMRLCGSSDDTHYNAVLYFQIIMGCMMPSLISLVINAAQRGAGNTRIAMRTNVTSNLINMALNYLLIQGNFGFPALGIKGAAIATVLGTVTACIMSIASIIKFREGKNFFINLPYILREKIKPGLLQAKNIMRIASNIFVEQVFMRIGFMSVAVMAAKLGTNEFAAHQVGMNIMSLSFSFGDGMQVAAVTLIGQSLGAGRPEQAKMYGKLCRKIGYGISACLSVIYLLGGKFLYRLYFKEEAIIQMGVEIMAIMVVIVILQIAQVIYMGCLRGAGDVVFTTVASTISVTFIRPIASYLFCYALHFGIAGIWLGVVADQLMRYILTSWRFRSGKWTKIHI